MSSGIFNRNTGFHNRQSLRLNGYDYSQPGHYFITLCIGDRTRHFFGDVIEGKMVLNDMGMIADYQLDHLPERFPNIALETYQIMPNHIHAIITMRIPSVRATLAVARPENAVARPDNAEAPSGNADDLSGNPDAANDIYDLSSRAGASPAPTAVINVADLTGAPSVRATLAVAQSPNTNAQSPNTNAQSPKTLAPSKHSKNKSLGDIIGAYKSIVFNDCLDLCKAKNEYLGKLWHRNYYDHIIRNHKSHFYIRKYILENPIHWITDTRNHINHEFDDIEMTEHNDLSC